MKKETGYPSIDKIHEEGLTYLQKNPFIPNINISTLISLLNIFNKDDCAVDMQKVSISYDAMEKEKRIVRRALQEIGLKKGDIVTVCMNNLYQAILVFLAANDLGAITTFLNYRASLEEIKKYLNEFDSPIFVNCNRTKEYNDVIRKSTNVKNIITLKKEDIYNANRFRKANHLLGYSDYVDFSELEDISRFNKNLINPVHSGKNDALLLFTSGSSGKPKTIILTNENVIANGIYCKNTINIPQIKKERCFAYVPFKYPYGFATSVILTFMCNRTVVLAPDGLNGENIKDVLNKINYFYGSPALLDELIKLSPNDLDLSEAHTFVTGGDFFTSNNEIDGRNFFESHGSKNITFCNGAGNGETVATWSSSVGATIKKGTVGRILVGSNPLIVNPDTLEEVKYNEEGKLLINGKHVFRGYYGDNESTSKCFVEKNGKMYFDTGTLGKMDEERYFTLTGRDARYYIKNDGNKVYCEKIQNFISKIDVVQSCVVVPQRNDEERYVSKAYIVLKNNIFPDENTRNYIFEKCTCSLFDEKNETINLNDFEIPSSIEFVPSIELTEAEKINFRYYEDLANTEVLNSNKKVLKK